MKKILGIVGIIISFLLIYFLQVNFFNWFTIAGVKPNLFIVLIVVLGLFAGKKVGITMGLVLGIYLDILTSKTIGFSGIIFMLLALVVSYLDKTFSKDSKIIVILTVIAGTIVFELITYIYTVIKFSTLFEFITFSKILSIELIFNILLTIILHPLIKTLGSKLENIFNRSKVLTGYF